MYILCIFQYLLKTLILCFNYYFKKYKLQVIRVILKIIVVKIKGCNRIRLAGFGLNPKFYLNSIGQACILPVYKKKIIYTHTHVYTYIHVHIRMYVCVCVYTNVWYMILNKCLYQAHLRHILAKWDIGQVAHLKH